MADEYPLRSSIRFIMVLMDFSSSSTDSESSPSSRPSTSFSLMASLARTSSKADWAWRLDCPFCSEAVRIFFSTSLLRMSRFSMLLSTLSTVFSSSPRMRGADFLTVLTSWSLCLPASDQEYRG